MPRTKEQTREYNQNYYTQEEKRNRILEQKKVYYKENKKIIREKAAKNYILNKDKVLAEQREYYSKLENRPRKIYGKTKERAEKAGHEFTITIEDIIIPEVCPYLGIKLTHDLGKGQQSTNSSIDRIDNNKGYIPGNVRIISRLANSMKTNSTREQRVAFAKAVLNDETL